MMQEAQVPSGRSGGSCTECRRRKQKCDRLQPCNNCRRRFPEPECSYPLPKKPGKIKSAPAPRPVPNQSSEKHTYTRKAPIPRTPKCRSPNKRPVILARWSGVDLTTEYPIYHPDLDSDSSIWETIDEPDSSSQTGITSASTSRELIVAKSPTRKPLAFTQLPKQNLWHFAGPVEGMGALPIPATKQNALLIQTFGKLLHQFKGSFDGDPDPDNPFIIDYVPWCIQSPLLAQTSLYISARSLTERHYVDETTAMTIKGNAIHTLNTHLQSEHWVSDEVLAGVVQFVSIEWFFGEREVVTAHLRGLREMVRLRGGFTSAGVGALVTKVALVDDTVIAMSLESNPVLRQGPDFNFDYREPPKSRFKLRFSSPFLLRSFAFSSVAEATIHPMAASILDDMQFLVNTVLELGKSPSLQDLKKLQSTATWIHDRICNSPKDLVEAPQKVVILADEELHDLTDNENNQTEQAATVKPHSLLPQYPEFSSGSASPSFATSGNSPSAETNFSSTPDGRPTEQPSRSATSPSPSATNSSQTASTQEPDPLYAAVRLAAPLYALAISTRQPFSNVCSPADALQVLAATWRIPLSRWRSVIGIMLFTLISIVSTTSACGSASNQSDDGDEDAKNVSTRKHLRPHAGFVKVMLQIGFMQISLEDWEVGRETMDRALRLLEWLRGVD